MCDDCPSATQRLTLHLSQPDVDTASELQHYPEVMRNALTTVLLRYRSLQTAWKRCPVIHFLQFESMLAQHLKRQGLIQMNQQREQGVVHDIGRQRRHESYQQRPRSGLSQTRCVDGGPRPIVAVKLNLELGVFKCCLSRIFLGKRLPIAVPNTKEVRRLLAHAFRPMGSFGQDRVHAQILRWVPHPICALSYSCCRLSW